MSVVVIVLGFVYLVLLVYLYFTSIYPLATIIHECVLSGQNDVLFTDMFTRVRCCDQCCCSYIGRLKSESVLPIGH